MEEVIDTAEKRAISRISCGLADETKDLGWNFVDEESFWKGRLLNYHMSATNWVSDLECNALIHCRSLRSWCDMSVQGSKCRTQTFLPFEVEGHDNQ